MKKPYEDEQIPRLFTHPKKQIDDKINQLERIIENRQAEISVLSRDLKEYEDELAIWREYQDIVRTYQITDEVRERLIRTKTYINEPNP